MRTGEVCALTWNDIDFKKEIINIEHNVYDKPKDEKGRWFIGTTKTKTKTETGTRKIHLSQTLKIALLNYKKKQDYLKKIYGKKYKEYDKNTNTLKINIDLLLKNRIDMQHLLLNEILLIGTRSYEMDDTFRNFNVGVAECISMVINEDESMKKLNPLLLH